MPQGDTVFFPMTDYWMRRLVDGRRVEVRARTAHWARLIPGRRWAAEDEVGLVLNRWAAVSGT